MPVQRRAPEIPMQAPPKRGNQRVSNSESIEWEIRITWRRKGGGQREIEGRGKERKGDGRKEGE